MNYRGLLIAAVFFILYIQWEKTVKKTSQVDTKLCQLQLSNSTSLRSCINFPHEIFTNQSITIGRGA